MTVRATKLRAPMARVRQARRGSNALAEPSPRRRLSPPEGFLIRKAPGNDSFDFGQFVDFSPGSTSVNTPVQKHGRRFDDKENESVLSEADWDDESMLMESLSGVSVARVAPNNVCLVPQQYETPLFPCGCIFKFVLLSTHGDGHYVGLSGAWSRVRQSSRALLVHRRAPTQASSSPTPRAASYRSMPSASTRSRAI